MDVAIIGGGICGLSLALNLRQRGIAAASTSERARSSRSASASRCYRMRCASSRRSVSATNCSPRHREPESAFFNRFGQLIYKEARGKFAGYQYRKSAFIAASCI